VKASLSTWLRGLGMAAALLGTSRDSVGAQASDESTAPRITNLAGARNQPGLFTQRLVLPANFCGPVHTHDRDLHGLVLRGVLRMGFADSTGRLDVREYSAGSFVVVPAGRRHLEGSAVETEIHLSGIGPLSTRVVETVTPQRCTPGGGD
jgi:quercetin dioxygenase-like cupin family protein